MDLYASKEININIEGYNVNGICVGCLNYNRKMSYNDETKEYFKNIADIYIPEEISVQLCWECTASVRKITKFKTMILHSYEILNEYSSKHMYLDSPEEVTSHAVTFLSTRPTKEVNIRPKGVQSEKENQLCEEKIKIEDDLETDSQDSQNLLIPIEPLKEEDDIDHAADAADKYSTDEEVTLSTLKKKKSKKTDKSKRKKCKGKEKEKDKIIDEKVKSKLKNLPPNLVELRTVSDKELHEIRHRDLTSDVFVKAKYKCAECILFFPSQKSMNDHYERKHVKKPTHQHRCDICNSYLQSTSSLSSHRGLHSRTYRCRECDVTTASKRVMMSHVAKHAGYQCHHCGIKLGSKSKLNYHKSVCSQEKPQCDCCGKVFANKITLKCHLKNPPDKTDDKSKEAVLIPCKGCDKVFYSKKSYSAHVVIHEGLQHPCPECGKLFQWKRNLARHIRNHRERDHGTRHECRPCGKRFSSKECYNNHMKFSKKHVSEDAFLHQCNYCSKKYATKWCLKDHVDWDHLKKIKYQCSYCLKAFKTSKIMVAHVNNIHVGKKNGKDEGEHLCDICGKSYKSEKRLKGHAWSMHTSRSIVRSFRCKLCPAMFTWQTSVYKHMKMMHPRGKQSRPMQKKEAMYPELELGPGLPYHPVMGI